MSLFFFFSSRRRHTRFDCDWSSDVCSSDLLRVPKLSLNAPPQGDSVAVSEVARLLVNAEFPVLAVERAARTEDRKSTRLNSSHSQISYAVFCLKKKTVRTVTSALITTTSYT